MRNERLPVLRSIMKYGYTLFLCSILVFFVDFIIYIFLSNVHYSMDLLSWVYYSCAALGHATLFSVVLYLLFYVPLGCLFKNKIVAVCVYLLAATLVQITIVLDIAVFYIYKYHINKSVADLIFGGAITHVFDFDFWMVIKFLLIGSIPTLIPFLIAIFISNRNYNKLKMKSIKYSFVFLISCFVISHVGHAVAHANKQFSIPVSTAALPWFYPLKVDNYLVKMGIIAPDELTTITFAKPNAKIQYPLNKLEVTDSISGYNIIHILIDSWNPDTYNSDVCPYILSFAEKGHTFTNHMSSHNATQGSIFSFFTGMSFAYETDFNTNDISPLFIDRLLEHKYHIEIFPSANFTSPPLHKTVFKRVPDINISGKGDTPYERDIDITQSFLHFLDNRDKVKPFYSFLFYDLPHSMNIPKKHHLFQPCWETPQYIRLNNSLDRIPFYNLYKNCVHYTDELIGKVLSKIDEKGLLENTIILISGDHGQEFNENKKNYWGHTSNYSKWQVQVPLVIYYPGIEEGKAFDHLTTHYDISPTILNRFLGVRNLSSDYSIGYDLWDTIPRHPVVMGNYTEQGFVLSNAIVTVKSDKLNVYDYCMNEVPRSEISIPELKEGVRRRNVFFR